MAGQTFPSIIPNIRQDRDEVYDRLPSVAKECAYALDAKYGAPPRLIYTAILGAFSAAIGPLFTVKTPDWHAVPISSWTMMSFASGSGKTAIYRELAKPFQDSAAAQRARYAADHENFRNRHDQWKFEVSLLRKQLSRKTTTAMEKKSIEAKLEALVALKPKPPKERPLVINNFDHESFMGVLQGFEEVVAIIPNEGDQMLGGRWLSKNASALNDIHDGLDPPQYRREKKPSITAEHPFVSFNLYTRPDTTERFRPSYKKGRMEKSRLVTLGFLARFRVAVDNGAWKSPFLYRPPDPDACIRALQDLLKRYLDRQRQLMESGSPNRIELELAPEAVATWKRIVHTVKVARDNEWADNEFAGKILVHTGSLAATIHVAESESRLITLSAVERAWALALDYEAQYTEAFAPPPPPSKIQQDARLVEDYLRANYVLLDYSGVDLEHMAHMLGVPLQRIKAVAHHFVHFGLAMFCAGTRGTKIDVSPMMAPTRNITRR